MRQKHPCKIRRNLPHRTAMHIRPSLLQTRHQRNDAMRPAVNRIKRNPIVKARNISRARRRIRGVYDTILSSRNNVQRHLPHRGVRNIRIPVQQTARDTHHAAPHIRMPGRNFKNRKPAHRIPGQINPPRIHRKRTPHRGKRIVHIRNRRIAKIRVPTPVRRDDDRPGRIRQFAHVKRRHKVAFTLSRTMQKHDNRRSNARPDRRRNVQRRRLHRPICTRLHKHFAQTGRSRHRSILARHQLMHDIQIHPRNIDRIIPKLLGRKTRRRRLTHCMK